MYASRKRTQNANLKIEIQSGCQKYFEVMYALKEKFTQDANLKIEIHSGCEFGN